MKNYVIPYKDNIKVYKAWTMHIVSGAPVCPLGMWLSERGGHFKDAEIRSGLLGTKISFDSEQHYLAFKIKYL